MGTTDPAGCYQAFGTGVGCQAVQDSQAYTANIESTTQVGDLGGHVGPSDNLSRRHLKKVVVSLRRLLIASAVHRTFVRCLAAFGFPTPTEQPGGG